MFYCLVGYNESWLLLQMDVSVCVVAATATKAIEKDNDSAQMLNRKVFSTKPFCVILNNLHAN